MATHHLTEEQYRGLHDRISTQSTMMSEQFNRIRELTTTLGAYTQFINSKNLAEEFTAFVVANRMEK